MIKVENKSKEEIAEIGRKIGEAFADEKAGIVTMLTREQVVKAFEIMTECFYRAGVLYTTSEKGEGYLAYWRKRAKPAMSPALHMIKRFLCELPPKEWMAVAGSGGHSLRPRYGYSSESKKYIRCGMELCSEKKLSHGISLYTMAYNRTRERSLYDE